MYAFRRNKIKLENIGTKINIFRSQIVLWQIHFETNMKVTETVSLNPQSFRVPYRLSIFLFWFQAKTFRLCELESQKLFTGLFATTFE